MQHALSVVIGPRIKPVGGRAFRTDERYWVPFETAADAPVRETFQDVMRGHDSFNFSDRSKGPTSVWQLTYRGDSDRSADGILAEAAQILDEVLAALAHATERSSK